MPEETTNANVMNIERQGVSLDFVPTTINRGDNKGSFYPCPKVPETPEEKLAFFEKIIKFVGLENAGAWCFSKLKQQCQAWCSSATTGDDFNAQAFRAMVIMCQVVRKTISDLTDELDEVSEQLTKFSHKTALTQDEQQIVIGLIKRMGDINQAIDDRRRKKQED